MKFAPKLLAALTAVSLTASAFAQNSFSIPIPASSVSNGGRAVVGFTMPAPMSPEAVQIMVQDALDSNGGAYQSWTTNFIGRTLNWNAGRFGQSVTIGTDGTVTAAGWGRSLYAPINLGFPLGYETLAFTDPFGRVMYLSPHGHNAFGTPPTGFSWSMQNCAAAPCYDAAGSPMAATTLLGRL